MYTEKTGLITQLYNVCLEINRHIDRHTERKKESMGLIPSLTRHVLPNVHLNRKLLRKTH